MAQSAATIPDKCPITGASLSPERSESASADEQKTLVLTGASQGIGHATAKLFEENGWRVVTCSRRAFTSACPWQEGPEDHIQIDLSDSGQPLNWSRRAEKKTCRRRTARTGQTMRVSRPNPIQAADWVRSTLKWQFGAGYLKSISFHPSYWLAD